MIETSKVTEVGNGTLLAWKDMRILSGEKVGPHVVDGNGLYVHLSGKCTSGHMYKSIIA